MFDRSLSGHIRNGWRKVREGRERQREQAAAQFEREADEADWAEAMRWTEMQEEFRRRGVKC